MLSALRSSTVGSYLPIFGTLQWVHFKLIAPLKKLTKESARIMVTADASSEAPICQLPKSSRIVAAAPQIAKHRNHSKKGIES